MNRFPSSLDNLSKGITWGLIVFAIVIVVTGFISFVVMGNDLLAFIGPLTSGLLIVVLVIATYFYRPAAIVVGDEGLAIERKAGPVNILYTEIKSIRLAVEGEMKRTIRTLGNGGLWGYTGQYYNKKLGYMRLYCSQRRNYVVIDKTDGKRIVISPDDPAALLAVMGQKGVASQLM